MKDKNKTKSQLTHKSDKLRQRNAAFEKSLNRLKNSERLLRKFEYERELALNSISELLIYQGKNQKIIWANKAAGDSVGLKPEELTGRHCYEIWHKRKKPCEDCPVVKVLKTGKYHREEITTPDGKVWAVRGYPVRGEKEDQVGAVEIVLEITEQKKFEEALRESEEKYRSLIEDSIDGIAVVQGLKVKFVNKALLKMFGFKNENEIVGRKFTDFVSAENRKSMTERGRAREKGKDVLGQYNFKALRKDGTKFDAEISVSRISYQGNRARQGVIRDISERKQVEEAVQIQREELQTIIDSVPAYIFYKDRKGRHIYVNKALADATGIPKEKWVGKTISELLPKLAERYIKDDEEVMTSGKPKMTIIEPFETPEGIRWAQTDKIPIKDKKGNVIGLTASSLDITERKKAEEKIKASLKEKEVMLREIHHRVKNNLQIILSLLRLQSRLIKDKKMQDIFKVSQNRIISMALVHESLYKSEDLARIDLSDYINKVTSHLLSIYREKMKDINLKLDIGDIYFDINKAIPYGLIVSELVSNSIKHAFPGVRKGEIVVKLHKDKQGKYQLTIRDTGVGFPDVINFRNPDTLGLQLVNDLVKQIGGTINLEKRDGTIFKITC